MGRRVSAGVRSGLYISSNLILYSSDNSILTTVGTRPVHMRYSISNAFCVTSQAPKIDCCEAFRVSFTAVVFGARKRDRRTCGLEVVHRTCEIDRNDGEELGDNEYGLDDEGGDDVHAVPIRAYELDGVEGTNRNENDIAA